MASRRKIVDRLGLGALVLALSAGVEGCAAYRSQKLCQALIAQPLPESMEIQAAYTVACPDVVELAIVGRPELSGPQVIEPDGTVSLGPVRVRVERMTPDQIRQRVADLLETDRSQVGARVLEYRSRQVFVFGAVNGTERSVPYRGPETVTELLRRAGGLERGADLRAVDVVRSNVTVGRRPEVFPIDLEAILLRGDASSDIRLEPYDQIYVGESRRGELRKELPFAAAAERRALR